MDSDVHDATPTSPAQPIRVVVVDDSALIRAMLAAMIRRQPDMLLAGAASDPLMAREMIRELNPDVITLDIEMPRMNGLDFLERLMRLRPTPVVMISTLTSQGSEQTLRALELGAVDYVQKPGPGSVGNLAELEDAICTRLRVAARARVRRLAAQEPRDAVPSTGAQVAARGRLLFIGASTGGTEAIRDVLAGLPADGPPILVAQHMPAGFTRTFARRLDATCPMHVSEAEDGEPVLPGHAYIAPGSHHLLIERRGGRYWIALSDAPEVNRHRPSVDVLFRSAASVVGSRAVGVILTGMGRDGAAGLAAMRAAGAYNLAQDEASCVVFGMPREAIAAGAAHEVVSLPQMARHVYDALGRPAHGAPTVGANSAGVTA